MGPFGLIYFFFIVSGANHQQEGLPSRRLLSDDSPETQSIFCYPSGTCSLSSISGTNDGFSLFGESFLHSIASLDLNGDGFPEIVTSSADFALPGETYNGKVSVLFGIENRTGNLILQDLMDGFLGFRILGVSYRHLGTSVSAAGDVNGDGLPDLLITATCPKFIESATCITGQASVIYGNRLSSTWPNSTLRLHELADGERGYTLLGDRPSGSFGVSSQTVGDINGDKIDDFMVGAGLESHNNTAYVIFGSQSSTALRNVSDCIDGQRGFVYQMTIALGAQGTVDFNGDNISDFLIFYATRSGGALAVSGSRDPNFWGSGAWDESFVNNMLNSTNNTWPGFFISWPYGKFESSAKGDFNGDGILDLILLADLQVIVVFGSKNTSTTFWADAIDSLWSVETSGIRGARFALNSNPLDVQVIDFNDDGIDDLLIGTPGAVYFSDNATFSGVVYVLFGTRDPLRWVRDGGSWDVRTFMDGVRGCALQGPATKQYVLKVLASDFNGDHVGDLLVQIGYSDLHAIYGASNASFLFRKNFLYLTMGQTTILTLNNLDVTTRNAANLNDTNFLVEDISHGKFTYVGSPLVPIANFSRKDIADSLVQFVHDGERIAPEYRLVAIHPMLGLRAIYSHVNVEFYIDPSPPSLERNQATIEQGTPLILTSNELIASDIDGTNGTLIFLIRSVKYARFDRLAPNGSVVAANVLQFEQQAIFDRLIQLVPDGGRLAPLYSVAVFDGNSTTPGKPAVIQFLYAPMIFVGSVVLNPGESNYLRSQDVNASDAETLSSSLILEVGNISQGEFLLAGSNVSLNNFSQDLLTANKIIFVCPEFGKVSFSVRAFDGRLFSSWQSPDIIINRPPLLQVPFRDISIQKDRSFNVVAGPVTAFSDPDGDSLNYTARLSNNLELPDTVEFEPPNRFRGVLVGVVELAIIIIATDPYGLSASGVFNLGNLNSPPNLILHPMTVDEGQATLIRYQNIQAEDSETPLPEDLIIEVGNVKGGRFIFVGASDGNVTAFRQLILILGTLQFLQEGDDKPGFAFRASDGRLESEWKVANVTLNYKPRVKLQSLPLRDQEVIQGEEFQFWLPSQLFEDPDGERLKVTAQLQGGIPLPKEIQFKPPNHFHGTSSSPGTLFILLEATDSRQLTVGITFNLFVRFPLAPTDLKAVATSISSIGGVGLSVAAFLWIRRRIAMHRQDFQFANALRFTLNLEYYDFTRFMGDTYKTRVNDFLQRLQLEHRDFYSQLDSDEKNHFAVCVAEILTKRGLVSRSDYSGLFGLLCFLNVGWPYQLDLQQFETQNVSIAAEAVNAWNSQSNPVTYWPYHEFDLKEQMKVLCCCAKSLHTHRWYGVEQGVALSSLKKRERDDVLGKTRIEVLEEETREMAVTIKLLSAKLEASERKAPF